MLKHPNATKTAASKLPVFNQTISIEVDVDTIHQKLMGTFPEDYKHKEILSHAIVGSAMEHGGIGFIYNALNGYTNDVDFGIGEVVECTSKDRIVYTPSTPEKKANWEYAPIGQCTIVAINIYNTRKLRVEFISDKRDGSGTEVKREWVDHKTCSKWAERVEIVHNAH